MAYPGLVKGGVRHVFVICAHAQIVGRCGFEREYSPIIVRTYLIERKPAP